MTAPRNQPAHGGLDFGAAFTGRQNELRELRAAVERARTGAASIVLVQGAPGTGKTTLVHHFLAELGEFMVLTTAATPSARPAAFDCLSRLLRPVTVPAQGLPGPGPRYGPAGGDPSAFGPRSLWRLLDSPSADPLFLFVDDAHWADGPTLRSLAEAVREGGRLCVVLAARRSRTWDAETQQALQSVHPVSLGELSEGDAASLVGSVLGEAADHALTRRLLLRSGRHPLYLRGLLASTMTRRDPLRAPGLRACPRPWCSVNSEVSPRPAPRRWKHWPYWADRRPYRRSAPCSAPQTAPPPWTRWHTRSSSPGPSPLFPR